MICVCCEAHLLPLLEKTTHSLCAACTIEVSALVANKVEKGHTFQVLKNSIIQVQERIRRRWQDQLVASAPRSCRLDSSEV